MAHITLTVQTNKIYKFKVVCEFSQTVVQLAFR